MRSTILVAPGDIRLEERPDPALAQDTDAIDEVYGNDPAFRAGVQALGLGYVLAVACDRRLPGLSGAADG